MDILVLGGGYGTRLFGEYNSKNYLPKGLVKIGNKSAIDHALSAFSRNLIGKVIVETNREGEEHYRRWARSREDLNVEIYVEKYSNPRNCLGSLETIQIVADDLKFREPILLLAPDNIFTENQDSLITNYKGEDAKIATYEVGSLPEASKYGVIEVRDESIIFCEEKPLQPKSKKIRTSCEIWSPRTFDYLRKWNLSGNTDKVGDFINYSIVQGLRVTSHPVSGRWIDIGSERDLENARRIIR